MRQAPVSVVIPCWNAEPFIARTLESVLSQEPRPREILVVDDGSSDRSIEVIRGFGPDVRWLTGPNRGVSAARNRGVSETGEEWMIFLDADDLLEPGTVKRRLQAATQDTGLVACDWREFTDEAQTSPGRVRQLDMAALAADAELACATDFWAPPAALMYRRAIVEATGGFRTDLPVIQDARFIFDAVRAGARVVRDDHIGAAYRVQAASLSRRNPARFAHDVLVNGRQIEALWRQDGDLSDRRNREIDRMWNWAAQVLFRAGDPQFRPTIAELRAAGRPLTARNRVAANLSALVGQHLAAGMFEGAGRLRNLLRPGR